MAKNLTTRRMPSMALNIMISSRLRLEGAVYSSWKSSNSMEVRKSPKIDVDIYYYIND
jgi:hypothetical protein